MDLAWGGHEWPRQEQFWWSGRTKAWLGRVQERRRREITAALDFEKCAMVGLDPQVCPCRLCHGGGRGELSNVFTLQFRELMLKHT